MFEQSETKWLPNLCSYCSLRSCVVNVLIIYPAYNSTGYRRLLTYRLVVGISLAIGLIRDDAASEQNEQRGKEEAERYPIHYTSHLHSPPGTTVYLHNTINNNGVSSSLVFIGCPTTGTYAGTEYIWSKRISSCIAVARLLYRSYLAKTVIKPSVQLIGCEGENPYLHGFLRVEPCLSPHNAKRDTARKSESRPMASSSKSLATGDFNPQCGQDRLISTDDAKCLRGSLSIGHAYRLIRFSQSDSPRCFSAFWMDFIRRRQLGHLSGFRPVQPIRIVSFEQGTSLFPVHRFRRHARCNTQSNHRLTKAVMNTKPLLYSMWDSGTLGSPTMSASMGACKGLLNNPPIAEPVRNLAHARAGLQNKFAPGTYRSQWQGKGDEQYFCRLQRPEPSQSVENEPIGCFKSIPTGPIALLYTLFHHGATALLYWILGVIARSPNAPFSSTGGIVRPSLIVCFEVRSDENN
ncbi:hypothetical protein M747DRAFT_317725 [Aspergillus niger ATCC 13496]|uniref:Contig An07c0070, genomic contig n=3 Tax=Aspergillus niger TaxID=5061 RepID=A2QMN1_ASPNC|nr:uncharacterized protein An07g02710 [Aspergillus niger]RDH16594.1 hypothetical protein M747DRAFT_317725 [Aspergillus niger ATCC 13496]CAK39359.1 unnamed protein product [Aspergillus niger]